MAQPVRFGDVLEAVEQLSQDEQETLVSIVERRLMERRRQRLVQEVQEARREYSQGESRATTTDDLLDEILT